MLTTIAFYILPFVLVYHIYATYIRLAKIPGPFLNKFTNIPRLLSVYRRNPHDEQVILHQRYGDLVRLGPNMVSVSGPDYIPQIYGIGKGLIKSDFYSVFQNVVNGRRAASLVAMTDESEHARTKRSIAHAYSLSTLVEFETLVDSTTEIFLKHLDDQFASTEQPLDLGRWLQYYAFDVIGELTFSKRLGFIETGEDVEEIISSIGQNFDYFSVLGQMPWLDETFLGKNPLYIRLFAKPVASPILKFAQKLLSERLDQKQEAGKDPTTTNKPDFLTRFLKIRHENTDAETAMSDRQLLSYLFMNINAGSDTIASTLRAIFYHLLQNPLSLNRLITELKTAHQNGTLTLPCPTWSETQSDQNTPYLLAVIREGIRLNPALSLPLERVVSKQGLTLTSATSSTSTFLPPGTIVGINPYVLHRHSDIFPDPEIWDPTRWLLASPTSPKLKTMEQNILSFGAGKRSCLGRNIALLELHKIIPAVVMRFEMGLLGEGEGGGKWRVRNSWVLGHEGLVVRVKRRGMED